MAAALVALPIGSLAQVLVEYTLKSGSSILSHVTGLLIDCFNGNPGSGDTEMR